MPGTRARFDALMPHTDATEYVLSPLVVSGTTSVARVAAGDYAISLGNSATVKLAYKFPGIIRLGEPHLESIPPFEQYNTPVGANNTFAPPYTVPGPNPAPTLSTYNPVNPVTVYKGVSLQSIDFIYLVGTDALSTNTVGVFAKQDLNAASPVVTTLLAQAANGLPTAAAATRYVQNVAIVQNSQSGFIVTPDTVITVEWDLATDSGGTADIFGVCFNYNFNFD